ncbi:MAG: flavin reductase family protein [Alphaproteobacteria bacterium]|nr:flavin reductase family protein [Alphaproteobacteria bacterium]
MASQLTMHAPPSPAEWRAAMGYFPTGVTIVTSWDGASPVGSTINAFSSVSLSPPLLLICLARENPIREPVLESGVFGVNILGCEAEPLAHRFAALDVVDRFEGHPFSAADDGAPQLAAAPVFIDCAVEAAHAAGDHLVVIGRGLRTCHASASAPLLYHRSRFPRFDPNG